MVQTLSCKDSTGDIYAHIIPGMYMRINYPVKLFDKKEEKNLKVSEEDIFFLLPCVPHVGLPAFDVNYGGQFLYWTGGSGIFAVDLSMPGTLITISDVAQSSSVIALSPEQQVLPGESLATGYRVQLGIVRALYCVQTIFVGGAFMQLICIPLSLPLSVLLPLLPISVSSLAYFFSVCHSFPLFFLFFSLHLLSFLCLSFSPITTFSSPTLLLPFLHSLSTSPSTPHLPPFLISIADTSCLAPDPSPMDNRILFNFERTRITSMTLFVAWHINPKVTLLPGCDAIVFSTSPYIYDVRNEKTSLEFVDFVSLGNVHTYIHIYTQHAHTHTHRKSKHTHL